jgi:hypothetical protein
MIKLVVVGQRKLGFGLYVQPMRRVDLQMAYAGSERRLGQREPTLIRAKLVDQTGYEIGVWVRDLSSTGARLETPPYIDIPKRFMLRKVFKDRDEIEAEIVWRHGVDLGARFVTADDTFARPKPEPALPVTKIPLNELRALARAAGGMCPVDRPSDGLS